MKPVSNRIERKILVTGGAGFIGSNFVLYALEQGDNTVVNLDNLTYAGNLMSLEPVRHDPRHIFIKGDIADRELVGAILNEHKPWAVVNFAAESHVDRSISSPESFIRTNVLGTFHLLEQVLDYWRQMPGSAGAGFRFMHVSTDEVYGSLGMEDEPFHEKTPYDPRSPYSASKAASDHLVNAFRHTYGLPAIITNCSNNYGPRQFPEKLIPLLILNGLEGKPLPIYGNGLNVRDWLYVYDHCEALHMLMERAEPGENYNIGGGCEKTNLEVAETVCAMLDDLCAHSPHRPHKSLLCFVKDRPGHDKRYAINISKVNRVFGWKPKETFETGLEKTMKWYLHNESWINSVKTGQYRDWISQHYGSEVSSGTRRS
jgi:dTDP-glucose 4,6-dehydratase